MNLEQTNVSSVPNMENLQAIRMIILNPIVGTFQFTEKKEKSNFQANELESSRKYHIDRETACLRTKIDDNYKTHRKGVLSD